MSPILSKIKSVSDAARAAGLRQQWSWRRKGYSRPRWARLDSRTSYAFVPLPAGGADAGCGGRQHSQAQDAVADAIRTRP